jgi:hypothetical protein
MLSDFNWSALSVDADGNWVFSVLSDSEANDNFQVPASKTHELRRALGGDVLSTAPDGTGSDLPRLWDEWACRSLAHLADYGVVPRRIGRWIPVGDDLFYSPEAKG